MRRRRLCPLLLLLAGLAADATVEASEPSWSFTGGVGRSTIGHSPYISGFIHQVLDGHYATATFTVAAQRSFLGFLRAGLRVSYLGVDTNQAYYCRFVCVTAGSPGHLGLFPVAATLEAYWAPMPALTLHAGAGHGPIWSRRTSERFPELNATSLRFGDVLYGGVAVGPWRVRPRIEVAWHRFSSVNFDTFVPGAGSGRLTSLEVAAALEVRP